MLDGWAKIHRCIQENWIWQDPLKLKWWLDLILMANHKEKKILINDELINIERGSYHTSELKLADRWGVDRKTVRKFLDLLQKDGMISVEKSRKLGTTIRLNNYENYQQGSVENVSKCGQVDKEVNKDMNNSFSSHKVKSQKCYVERENNSHLDNAMDSDKDNVMVNDLDNNVTNYVDINKKEKNDNNVENEKKDNKQVSHSGANVYETFEGNGFGLLSPVMVDIINDLVETYGAQWVNDAVLVAVASGKRNLKYVQGILKNWLANGRDHERGNGENGSSKQNINGTYGKWERNSYANRGGGSKETGFNNGVWTDFKPEEPQLTGDLCCQGLI